jgi:hypothetical protein
MPGGCDVLGVANGMSSFLIEWFNGEPAGTFSHGHVFINAPDLAGAQVNPALGYWHCDIADNERLSWSAMVYSLFGLPTGTPVKREWAVARYSKASRNALQMVRTYALGRKLGFILDAEIRPKGSDPCWIRVLAVPILANDRVVGLHGLKRPL